MPTSSGSLPIGLCMVVCLATAHGFVGHDPLSAHVVTSSRRTRSVATCRNARSHIFLQDYSVRLPKPLGIRFEEIVAGEPKGVCVAELVKGGNADLGGRVCVGDELVSVSAVVFKDKRGAGYTNWERQMVNCLKMDFDTIMSAIATNDGRYGCVDVVLKFRKSDASVARPLTDLRQDSPPEVTWDGARGVMQGKSSLPIRPPKDTF
mmetsp:Transcript_2666/g.7843  ORF Transcript_2666/g.7843 Transcript_2666/m.7843 type:complete len:206 (+) Transcript_2666:32-649(+)